MGETGTDFSQSNIASPAMGQESGLSGEGGNGGTNFPSPGFKAG